MAIAKKTETFELPVLIQIAISPETGAIVGADVLWRVITADEWGNVINQSDRGPVPIEFKDIDEVHDRVRIVLGEQLSNTIAALQYEQQLREYAEHQLVAALADTERAKLRARMLENTNRLLRRDIAESVAQSESEREEIEGFLTDKMMILEEEERRQQAKKAAEAPAPPAEQPLLLPRPYAPQRVIVRPRA